MQDQQTKKRGFAAISPERMREIASAGGIARKRAYDQAHGRIKMTVPSHSVPPQVATAGNNQAH